MGRREKASAFVIDECNLDLADFIRGYTQLSYRDLGLERGASDQKLVEHANYHGAIIVSRNKRDFRHEMRIAAERSTLANCYEGAGLVTVPDGLERFDFKSITRNLRFRGQRVMWADVYQVNLEVLVHRDVGHPPEIRLLPRCPNCLRDHADCDICASLAITEADYRLLT
jgi:hypothetical protein